MDATLKGAEIACIKELAKRFEEGRVNTKFKPEEFGLTAEESHPVLLTMQLVGAISEFWVDDGTVVTISANAVQLARQYEAEEAKKKEGKDIVELVKLTLRKHPVTAWAFIIFGVLLALLAAGADIEARAGGGLTCVELAYNGVMSAEVIQIVKTEIAKKAAKEEAKEIEKPMGKPKAKKRRRTGPI